MNTFLLYILFISPHQEVCDHRINWQDDDFDIWCRLSVLDSFWYFVLWTRFVKFPNVLRFSLEVSIVPSRFPPHKSSSWFTSVSSLCLRFKAGGGRGVDVSAGPAGPVPEDAGHWPGVCPGQEGGARPVSCSTSITGHTSLSDMEELKSLVSRVGLDGVFPSACRWNHAFKNQITTLQSQAKNRANPNRSEVQANLSLFLEAASGFYTQVRFRSRCRSGRTSRAAVWGSAGVWYWSVLVLVI